MLHAGNDQTLSVTFTPTDTTDYTTATQDRDDQRDPGHADDHLGQPGGHHLRHGLGRPRNWTPRPACRARLAYTPGQRDGADAGNDQTLSVTFTPDRHDRLHHGHDRRDDQRDAGHADDHLVHPGGDHLRHGLGQHATGRHGQRAGDRFVYTPAAGRCCTPATTRRSR